MAGRRSPFPDIRGVTVRTFTGPLVLRELFFDRDRFRVRRLLVVFVASRARGYGYVGSQPAQRRRARNVDVTGRAFHHVLTLTAFVTEPG